MLLRKTAKDLGLTQLERLVLIQMSECFPEIRKSQKTIADLIGCSTKTVQRSISKLLEKGYIKCVQSYSRENNTPAIYKIDLEKTGLIVNDSKEITGIVRTYSESESEYHKILKHRVWWISSEAADYCKENHIYDKWDGKPLKLAK